MSVHNRLSHDSRRSAASGVILGFQPLVFGSFSVERFLDLCQISEGSRPDPSATETGVVHCNSQPLRLSRVRAVKGFQQAAWACFCGMLVGAYVLSLAHDVLPLIS